MTFSTQHGKKSSPTGDAMRIAIVNEFFYPDNAGGTGAVLTELAECLRQSHPEVEITAFTSRNAYRSGTADYASYEKWNGIEIERVTTQSSKGKGIIGRLFTNALFATVVLAKLMAKHRRTPFDVVLVGTAPPTLVGSINLFRILCDVPYVYVVYDLDPDRAVVLGVLEDKKWPAKVLRSLQKSWLNAAQQVVVLGRCMKARLEHTYGIPEQRISVIPIGASPERIPLLSEGRQYRSRFGVAPEHFVLCYSGNFGRYHNFDTLLDVAARLKQEAPDVRFLLAGGGAQRLRIETRVRQEGLDNIILHNFVSAEDYPYLLASADVSVITLEPGMEGLCVPSKFYSILASGRPVLALLPEASEVGIVVTEEECGICAAPDDEQAIKDAIIRLKRQPDLTHQMGTNARYALCNRFTTAFIAESYYEVLARAAREAKHRRMLNRLPAYCKETNIQK